MKKIIETLKRKWAEYLIEIIVILAGILGAYGLNNWNEDRKQQIREIQLLSELHHGLEGMENTFTSTLQVSNENQIRRQVIIEVIEKELAWHDSLQQHFNRFLFFWPYTFDVAAYNSLENWGVNNLSNDSLRRQIVTLFQNEHPYLNTMFQQEYDLVWLDMRKNTRLDARSISEIRPADYQDFIENKDLLLDIRWLMFITEFNNSQRQRILNRIIDLRLNIKEEISRLKE